MWVQLWLRQLLAKAGVPEIIRQKMSSNHCPRYSFHHTSFHIFSTRTLASDPLDDIDSLWEESSGARV